MTDTQFIAEVYGIAFEINPDIKHSTSYSDVVKELQSIKDKALRMDIIRKSLEPQLPMFDNSPERFKKLAQDRIGNT